MRVASDKLVLVQRTINVYESARVACRFAAESCVVACRRRVSESLAYQPFSSAAKSATREAHAIDNVWAR